ncbi:MAG: hypothetical protein U1F24_00685 [Alphaproteobacteria bacterium]
MRPPRPEPLIPDPQIDGRRPRCYEAASHVRIFASSPKKNRVLRAAIVAAVIAGSVAVLVYRNAIDAASVVAWARGTGAARWATALEFLVVHMAAGLVFVPRLIMGLAAGVLFGLLWGSVLSLIGARSPLHRLRAGALRQRRLGAAASRPRPSVPGSTRPRRRAGGWSSSSA